MKKMKIKDFLKIYTAIVVVLGVVLIGLLSSCKTRYVQCDAYGTIDNQEIDKV